MRTFCKMADLLEERQNGAWKIEKFRIERNNLVAMMQGVTLGTYVKLSHNGECVISDISMEKRTNMDFYCNAYGDVLVGGLGIGMIILATIC